MDDKDEGLKPLCKELSPVNLKYVKAVIDALRFAESVAAPIKSTA